MITLMYHGITSKTSSGLQGREAGAELYDVPIENFLAQMHWLKDSKTPCVLTFDDGEMNNYELAFPILKELGFKAHFFCIGKRVGTNGYMGFQELKTMSAAGMIIGSHGLTHAILTNLKDEQVAEELRASKNYLERNLGFPINSFSVPRGFCNEKIIQMAHEAGYGEIFISEKPDCLKAVCTPRVAIKSNWSLKRMQEAVRGNIPPHEIIGDAFKNTAKIILRERGYNALRRILVYFVK